jgi:hypothetical protein
MGMKLGGKALAAFAIGVALLGCDSSSATDTSAMPEEDASLGASAIPTSGMRGDECRGAVGAVTVGKVIVPSGATCTLNGTRVEGDVEVGAEASVRIDSKAHVSGNLKGVRSHQILVLNTHVRGNVQADHTGTVTVGDGTFVGGNLQLKQGRTVTLVNASVYGDIQLEQNFGAIRAVSNRVGGDFQVFKNVGGVDLESNRIVQSLQCKENRPVPIGSGNVAGEMEDQCAPL